MIKTDLIVIGAGPGGYETAVKAAARGLQVVIVEAEEPGGTCLNAGCIPTKCLCKNAQVLNDLKESERWGIKALNYSFDLGQAVARKNEVVSTLRAGVQTLLSHKNITLVKGKARFAASHTIVVDETGEQYTAENILIATGSYTKYLPIEGIDLPQVLTSTEMLRLTDIPQRLCVIGGGVIGMEFASIFNAFGSAVTVLEYCKEMLPNFDADLSKRMRPAFKRAGIELINQAAVTGIKAAADGSAVVTYDCKGKAEEVQADIVLMAVGRAARFAELDLDKAGIAYTGQGITVDANMQTNVKGVYAVGDVNGLCLLAHAAAFQGERALHHLLGESDGIRLDLIPAAIFTQPEAASVGPTEQACKEAGREIKTYKAFMRANGKALAMGETEGMVKLIADADDRLIAGHIYGAHAADLVQELVPMIATGATVHDLAETIHAHPTLGEVIMNAAKG